MLLGGALVGALLVAPNLWVTIAGTELFPWTCAPMFAHHLGRDENRFAFRMLAETADGTQTELRWRDLDLQARRTGRLFFARFYGSAEPGYPIHDIGADTPAAFAARLGEFLAAVAARARSRCPDRIAGATGIVLVLDRVAPDHRTTGTRTIGRFDLARGGFTHQPEAVWH
jgi:hypothetical protein